LTPCASLPRGGSPGPPGTSFGTSSTPSGR
jgi:hypothetical protein